MPGEKKRERKRERDGLGASELRRISNRAAHRLHVSALFFLFFSGLLRRRVGSLRPECKGSTGFRWWPCDESRERPQSARAGHPVENHELGGELKKQPRQRQPCC